ncbi:MAG: ClpP family protease [Acutalibacteraceae bacterium]
MNSNSNDNNAKNGSDARSAQLEEIKELGSVSSFDGKHKIYCLTVIGEVEGHNVLPEQTKTTKYEHVIPQLVAVEESREIEGLLVVLNTVGGDVEAGLAIAELISGMKKPTVSFVLGGGHSIGVPLAVSAKRSYIAPSATMTVHPVRTTGLVIGVPQMMNHFARMQTRITEFVARNSKISPERFTELMMNTGEMVTDVGSVLSGGQAVSEGLIDEIGTLGTVIDGLYKLIEGKN